MPALRGMSLAEWIVSYFRPLVQAEGVRALARRLGVSASYVSDVRLGKIAPGPAILGPLGFLAEKTQHGWGLWVRLSKRCANDDGGGHLDCRWPRCQCACHKEPD